MLRRDVPDGVIAIDATALSFCCNEYAGRQFVEDAHRARRPVTIGGLQQLTSCFGDLRL